MNYGFMLGSDRFIGCTGNLTVTEKDKTTGEDKKREFFRIRETWRHRTPGSYLTVDCDIRDGQDNREVKLVKSIARDGDPEILVTSTKKVVAVHRSDGSLVIKVEQLRPDEAEIPARQLKAMHPVGAEMVETAMGGIEAWLRITGDFLAGPHHLYVTAERWMVINSVSGGNVVLGGGGLQLTANGFGY